MEIITGYTGKPHVTSEQDRDVNIGVVGKGSYVLQTGMQLAAEVSSNNEIKIRDGVLMHQGCTASIKKNTYDSLIIINGSQGMKRIDLIVARYEKNQDNGIESLDLKVIQGTPAESTPTVPEYTEGDIQAGDYVADMPMYQVIIDGLNITEVKKVCEVAPDIDALKKEITELNSKMPIITSMESNKQGVINLHGLKIVYGVYPLHAFVTDQESGGYKATINIASHHLTGNLWCAVTPRYSLGHPYVSAAEVTPENITLLSDAIVKGAYAAWMVIGVSSV